MRLHRGSSKDDRGSSPTAENLPLSASPPKVYIEVEVARAGRTRSARLEVTPGTLVRAVVRSVGEAPEGCVVLLEGTSVPLDTPIERPVRFTVVPTSSRG
jgi:sulfur carrier protein ThiS